MRLKTLALATLAMACSSTPTLDSGSGGGGGGGSSSSAGGSSAGGGMGGNGGGNSAGGGSSVSCDLPTRNLNGTCAPADSLQLYLAQHASVLVDGGLNWISGGASVSFLRTDGGTYLFAAPVLATAGPCTAYGYPLATTPEVTNPVLQFCTGAGTLEVSGGPTPFTMTPTGQTTPCYQSSLDGGFETLFHDGTALTIASSGSAAYPAFSLMMLPSEHLDLQVGTVTRGQALSVTWNAGTGDDVFIYIVTIDSTTDRDIICTVPDTGAYTLPAELTSQLLATAPTTAFIRVERQKQRRVEPASPFVVESVFTSWGVTRELVYQP